MPLQLNWLRMTAMYDLTYVVSRWCDTDAPAGRRCTLASMNVGRTIRSPSELMMTRCPGRLYSFQNLPLRVTAS